MHFCSGGQVAGIKPLRLPDRSATEAEIAEAALQYVRKVSGYRKPSRANTAAFDAAVTEIAESTRHLLAHLESPVADKKVASS